MRSTSRNGQRCGISFWIWLALSTTPSRRRASVASVNAILLSHAGSGGAGGGQKGGAADAIEQVGGELTVKEGTVLQ